MLRGRLAADSVMPISVFANATDRFPSRLRFVCARAYLLRSRDVGGRMSDKVRRSVSCVKPAKQNGTGSGPNWRTPRPQFGSSLLRLLLSGSAVLLAGCSEQKSELPDAKRARLRPRVSSFVADHAGHADRRGAGDRGRAASGLALSIRQHPCALRPTLGLFVRAGMADVARPRRDRRRSFPVFVELHPRA